MNALDKSRAEKAAADDWFDGKITEETARSYTGLSWQMIEWWYGRRYEMAAKAEALSNEHRRT